MNQFHGEHQHLDYGCLTGVFRGAGPVHVMVINPGGTSATSSVDIFTYLVLPSVASLSPAGGSPSGGTQVDITGTGFTASSSTVAFAR